MITVKNWYQSIKNESRSTQLNIVKKKTHKIYVNVENIVHETSLISCPLNIYAPLIEYIEGIIAVVAPTAEI